MTKPADKRKDLLMIMNCLRFLRGEKLKSFILLMGLFYTVYLLWSFQAPLVGVHYTRQADTLFTAYSYCKEETPFLFPKIIHRENTSGISIGEFPVWSYLLSLPCKTTGIWSETFPKYFAFILYLLNILIWWKNLQLIVRKFIPENDIKNHFSDFFVFFFFSTLGLAHFTIPLPDTFALFTAGIATYFAQTRPHTYWKDLLSILFMALTFATRPYLAPLFILLIPLDMRSWREIQNLRPRTYLRLLLSSLLALSFYFVWYKFWKTQSEIQYYNTSLARISETIQNFPHIITGFYEHFIRGLFHFVGLFALGGVLINEWRHRHSFQTPELKIYAKNPWRFWAERFFILSILSLVFIVLVKGDHFKNHGYYLAASFIFFIYFIFCLSQLLPPFWKSLLLIFYLLIGVINSTHLFHPSSLIEAQRIQNLLVINNVQQSEKIAAYLGEESNTTYFLYYAKRTGWAFAEKDSAESCPQGAHWKLWRENADIQLEKCQTEK